MTSSFSAEYGRAGGAVLNTTLKSGTNQLRGSAWEFYRNDAMNANDFFANRANIKKGEYLSNQFGAHGGRPGVGTKTFWFADYEGSIIKQARTWVRTVPTALQRASGFTNFSDLTVAAERQRSAADVLGRSFPARHGFRPGHHASGPAAGQVDPVTGTGRDASGLRARCVPRQQDSGEPDRPERPSTDAALPRARTRPGLNNNYTVNRLNNDDTHAFDVRVDHNFSANDRFFARYSFSDNHKIRPSPFDGDADGGGFSEGDEKVRVHGFAASHTHMFSPTLINEARFGFSREHTNRLQPNGDDLSNLPAQYGILGVPQVTAMAACQRCVRRDSVAARSRRLGRQRALQQHAAVQRQPDEAVQVAHLQGRLHLPGHLLRLDAAALRAGRVQLGRPLHVGRQPDRQQHGPGALPALADPIARARAALISVAA